MLKSNDKWPDSNIYRLPDGRYQISDECGQSLEFTPMKTLRGARKKTGAWGKWFIEQEKLTDNSDKITI